MKRTPLKTYAPLKRYTALRQQSPTNTKRAKPTGPDRNTVDAVLERDQHSCGLCGHGLSGQRGRDWSVQHRRPRRMGGDTRQDVNLPSNLFAVHGDGVSGCHGRIESHRAESYENGWLLHDRDVPSQRPICHAVHGWCYLTDDGRVEYAPPPVNVDGEIR